MKEKFIQFLKANEVYEAFICNLNKFHGNSSFDKYCRLVEPEDYVSGAFNWYAMQEASTDIDFWAKIDEKWEKYMKS